MNLEERMEAPMARMRVAEKVIQDLSDKQVIKYYFATDLRDRE
jgi:hypothetical protein